MIYPYCLLCILQFTDHLPFLLFDSSISYIMFYVQHLIDEFHVIFVHIGEAK